MIIMLYFFYIILNHQVITITLIILSSFNGVVNNMLILCRYGVAPDHPEVKNVINQFTRVARQENVNFYGNVTLGKDIQLHQLRQHYDAVLLVI